LLLLPFAAEAQERKDALISFMLPTRNVQPEAQRRLKLVAQAVADRTGLKLETRPAIEIETRLGRAQSLFLAAAVDQAAPLFDAVLEDGAQSPHRIASPEAFVSAHLTRASIALARGEDERAEELLRRVLRYDPSFVLRQAERSPPLEKALAGARHKLTGPLGASDLGQACADANVLVVGSGDVVYRFDRVDEGGRWPPESAREVRNPPRVPGADQCRLTAQAQLSDDVGKIAAALAGSSSSANPPRKRRAWVWAVVGLGVAAVSGAIIAGAVVGTRREEVLLVPHYPP
jgi:hypothetical protein